MPSRSISVHFVRAVLRHAVSRGLDPIALLRRNRISPRLLLEREARISIERFADLQVTTMLAMGDESLGYAQRPLPIGTWSMMCHAVIGCETLGQALARYCRFFQLFETGAHPHLQVERDYATITLAGNAAHQLESYFCELTLFNTHRFGSWLVQEHFPLLQVDLAYPPAASGTDYRHMFLNSPVLFDQPQTALKLSSGLLDKPVTQSQQSLRHFLRHPALLMLTQWPGAWTCIPRPCGAGWRRRARPSRTSRTRYAATPRCTFSASRA